jgi:hypothetical protein
MGKEILANVFFVLFGAVLPFHPRAWPGFFKWPHPRRRLLAMCLGGLLDRAFANLMLTCGDKQRWRLLDLKMSRWVLFIGNILYTNTVFV